MPNPTFRVNIIGRGGRRSAVGMAAYGSGKTLRVRSALAAAAYRAGETLRDHQQQQVYDYTDRDDVRHETILAPAHVPDWATDREALWNAVEARETRKDAQLARSIIIALPRELTLEQNTELLRDYVEAVFVSRGMIADLAIHDKEASDGKTNPHAHLLLTLREIEESGEWAKTKNREWNDQRLVEQWRASWEETQNAYLEAAEVEERVSLRSYADQGINRTPQLHHGYRVDQLERDGRETLIGELNRDIAQENQVRALMDVMLPGSLAVAREGTEPFLDIALLRADEISRMDEIALEDDQERGFEIGIDDE